MHCDHALPLPGMISTSNYVARKYGVRSAMPGFIGKELCRRQGAVLMMIKPDHAKYSRVSKDEIQAIIRRFLVGKLRERRDKEANAATDTVTAATAGGKLKKTEEVTQDGKGEKNDGKLKNTAVDGDGFA